MKPPIVTRSTKVLQLARDREQIGTADVVRLFKTNIHDAARLLYLLRSKGLLEADEDSGGYGRPVINRLTDAGRRYLCGRVCAPPPPRSPPDFGPLLTAFGR